MLKALKKKNNEYSNSERKSTAILTFVIFVVVGTIASVNMEWVSYNDFLAQNVPYLIGVLCGGITAFIAFKYPKVIHVTLFMLPLMIIGS